MICPNCGQDTDTAPDHSRAMKVLRSVSAEHGVSVDELRGPRRNNRLIEARRAVIQALRDCGLSLPQIGRFVHRDHTTVLHHLNYEGRV
jgi:chromosomal replication initiation ATPase DnaA